MTHQSLPIHPANVQIPNQNCCVSFELKFLVDLNDGFY